MTRVEVDQLLSQKLFGMDEPIEIYDANGSVVGHYLPEASYKKMIYGSLKIPLSDEEIERRRNETGGRTLPEIWNRLGR